MRTQTMRWVAVLAVLLLSAAASLADEKVVKLPADLALVPRDGTGFIAVRVAAGWEKAAGLRKMAKDDAMLSKFLPQMEKELGATPADIERLVVIFPAADSHEGPVAAITLVKPYDKAKLLEKFVPGSEEKKAGGKTYHASEKEHKAVYLVNDRTFTVSSPRALTEYLERSENKPGKPALDGALAAAAGKHDLVAGFNLSEVVGKEPPPPPIQPYLPLLNAPGSIITVDVAEKTVKVDGRVVCNTEDDAKAAEKAAQDGLEQVKTLLTQGLDHLSKPPPNAEVKGVVEKMTQFLKDAQTGLKDAKITRDGKTVHATLSVKSDDPASGMACTLLGFFMAVEGSAQSPSPPIKKEGPGR